MAPSNEQQDPSQETIRDPARRHGRIWWCSGLLAGPLAYLLSLLARALPGLTESIYGQFIGPATGWALARLTGWLPFSLAEWLLLLASVHWITRWITASRLDGMRLRTLGRASALNLREWSIVFAVFMLVFGLQYQRPTLAERMGWADDFETDLLEQLAAASVEEVNSLYRELHGSDDSGAATRIKNFDHVDQELERAWDSVASEFRLGSAAGWKRGRSKGLLISPLLSRLGLSGFYFPWTGEANRNRDIPSMRQPHVAAHEKAHQRGIAREDEASFLGWATARRSESTAARYSAAMYAHRRLLRALLRENPGRGQEILRARLPGVQRDVDDLHAWWNSHHGRATVAAERINDRYLRSHRIRDGRASYARSLRLLLLYASQRGGTLSP